MTRLIPLFTALFLLTLVISCSDDAATPPQDTVSFAGTVRDGANGTPMQGAEIVALRHDNGAEVARTVSDVDGSFTFPKVPRTALDVLVQKAGYSARRVENVDPTEQLDPEHTGLNVRMAPSSKECCDGVLTLTVTDANNAGIPQAKVQIKKNGNLIDDPRTDANGVVVVDNLCPGNYSIRISRDGYRVYEAAFVINESCEPVNHTAVLEAMQVCCTGVLTLTVKKALGAGIPGATVHLWKGGGIIATKSTDANGVAMFDSLCTGSYGINVEKQGYESRELTFTIGENCAPVEKFLVLEAPACCDGEFTMTVRDNNNNPIEGAKVVVKKNGVVKGEALTNASGVVVIGNLCEGGYTYRVSKEGWTVREGEFAINSSCDPVTRDVTMEQTQQVCCSGVLTLTVKDVNGNPIQGAKVLIKKNGVPISDPLTNASGVITVDGLCAGEYTYRISKDGWQVIEGSFAINTNCDPVTLLKTMEQTQQVCCSGVLTLTVKDVNGNPIQGAKVLVKKGGVAVEDPLTNAAGTIVIDGLCAGEYTYRISKEGWQVIEGSFVINTNCDPVTVLKTMEPTQQVCCSGVFTLTVKDANGNPIQGAKVYLKKSGSVVADPLTNANGQVVVSNLCAGAYTWKIVKDGFAVNEGSFAINEQCDPVVREATLISDTPCCTGVLTVTVKDGSNNPVAGAAVRLWKNSILQTTIQTDSNGVAVISDLCKGSYGVDVAKTGYQTREFTFSINASCDPFNKIVELIP
ncbi:MAG: carboxypeptidase regulatory-like domain-containing protein [Bacteroidia bacterium]|nr:carboxypeptidase regulatory-like domain-containing protein [Bacteroidia bacterium]